MFSATAVAQAENPHVWLDRMAEAVRTIDYEGTVIRVLDGEVELLKVVHTVTDGVVREKVVAQEGDGLEIIRNGNEVHCILPERKSVLVEEWNDQSTLFSTLPSSKIRFGNEYELSLVRHERVAARQAVLLAIRPHDDFRFGHRIWLDLKTGFPLQTQLLDVDGEPLEQVKFADITLGGEIHASALAPSYSTENFKWYTQPSRPKKTVVDSEWQSSELPMGFVLISTHQASLDNGNEPVTHMLYSDGLANVSVFIALKNSKTHAERSRVGASHSYSTQIDDHQVTAVGEVPAATVKRIAMSMTRD